MVTGSHNPPDYNGFKVACGKSTLYGLEVQEIADIIEGRRFVAGKGSVTAYPHVLEDTTRS